MWTRENWGDQSCFVCCHHLSSPFTVKCHSGENCFWTNMHKEDKNLSSTNTHGTRCKLGIFTCNICDAIVEREYCLQCTVVPLQYLKCYLNVIVKSKHHMQSIVKPRNVHSFTCHRHFFKRMITTRVIEILEKMVLQNLQYIVYVHSIWGLLFHSKYFILN